MPLLPADINDLRWNAVLVDVYDHQHRFETPCAYDPKSMTVTNVKPWDQTDLDRFEAHAGYSHALEFIVLVSGEEVYDFDVVDGEDKRVVRDGEIIHDEDFGD